MKKHHEPLPTLRSCRPKWVAKDWWVLHGQFGELQFELSNLILSVWGLSADALPKDAVSVTDKAAYEVLTFIEMWRRKKATKAPEQMSKCLTNLAQSVLKMGLTWYRSPLDPTGNRVHVAFWPRNAEMSGIGVEVVVSRLPWKISVCKGRHCEIAPYVIAVRSIVEKVKFSGCGTRSFHILLNTVRAHRAGLSDSCTGGVITPVALSG